jgi:hypothetical protein
MTLKNDPAYLESDLTRAWSPQPFLLRYVYYNVSLIPEPE